MKSNRLVYWTLFLHAGFLSLSCNKESYIEGISDNPNYGLPIVSTLEVTANGQNSATSGGNVSDDGGSEIDARGVCWSTDPEPTVALSSKTTDGTGTGSFTSSINGLTAGSTYHVRAYATNKTGTQYGQDVVFTAGISSSVSTCGAQNVHNPSKMYGMLTDQQGNTYKTIVIGNQEWMAENLKTTIYRNGTSISNVTDNTQWIGLTNGAWCYYNNNALFDCPYGKLYNWYAVNDSRNLCPIGWHVPTANDFNELMSNLGSELTGGGKLKSSGTSYWITPNISATNISGYSGLPGGFRSNVDGSFLDNTMIGAFWSSTAFDNLTAWRIRIGYDVENVDIATRSFKNGNAVRCIRD